VRVGVEVAAFSMTDGDVVPESVGRGSACGWIAEATGARDGAEEVVAAC